MPKIYRLGVVYKPFLLEAVTEQFMNLIAISNAF